MAETEADFAKFFSASQSGAAGLLGARPAEQDPDDSRLHNLPPYTRSLLRIHVPVVVTLAATRLPLRRILELGPGSIITFEKSCEEPLSLQVGNHDVAVGEAVKVGDKFGLRINSMVMPQEKFWAIRGKQDSPEPISQ